MNQYERFRAIHEYHNAVGQMFWTIERSVMATYSAGPWDDEYLVQTVRDTIVAHRRMVAAHDTVNSALVNAMFWPTFTAR